MPPVRSGNVYPPIIAVSQIYPLARLVETDAAEHDQLGSSAGPLLSFWRALGGCHVLGCLDELAKLFVGHRVPIHPKTIDCHFMRRCFFGIVLVGSHEKRTTGDPDHILERRLTRCR